MVQGLLGIKDDGLSEAGRGGQGPLGVLGFMSWAWGCGGISNSCHNEMQSSTELGGLACPAFLAFVAPARSLKENMSCN